LGLPDGSMNEWGGRRDVVKARSASEKKFRVVLAIKKKRKKDYKCRGRCPAGIRRGQTLLKKKEMKVHYNPKKKKKGKKVS